VTIAVLAKRCSQRTDRPFCARFDGRLARRSVRLWGEHGQPGTGNLCGVEQ